MRPFQLEPLCYSFHALVLGVNANRMAEAKIYLKEFRDEFERRFCLQESERNEVMALGIQFYPLTQKPNQKKESA